MSLFSENSSKYTESSPLLLLELTANSVNMDIVLSMFADFINNTLSGYSLSIDSRYANPKSPDKLE